MRELKFRAWNKVDGTMYTDAINNCKDTFNMVLKHPQIYDVMQFTEFPDKNGAEIYDGDVIHDTEFDYGTAVVYWDECGSWKLKFDSGETDWLSEFNEVSQVIGNIHQNPELLA